MTIAGTCRCASAISTSTSDRDEAVRSRASPTGWRVTSSVVLAVGALVFRLAHIILLSRLAAFA
jgi:hypothetical protein